jgi:integrase
LNKLIADVQRGEYVDPRKGAETFGSVAEQWITTNGHRKPKTLAGYRSLMDTIVLPRWGDVPLKTINYEGYSTWLGGLAVDGSQAGKRLSASRITQAHQLVGAVLKYAQRTGRITRNVAAEISRTEDLPQQTERERRYLTHAELLRLARAAGRFETLTLVLGYCGLRFGEAAALRRRHEGDRELVIAASATHVRGQGIVETTTKTKRSRHVPVPQPVLGPAQKRVTRRPQRPGVPPPARRTPAHRGIPACVRPGLRRGRDRGPGTARAAPHHRVLAISAGANVKVVQRMLGHATAAMTLDLYGHLLDDDLTGVADALGKAIESTAVSLRYEQVEVAEAG